MVYNGFNWDTYLDEHKTKMATVAPAQPAVKAQSNSYSNWLLKTADAERYNMPDPSVYSNQADMYRKLSWVLQAVDATASAGALTPFEVKRIVGEQEPKDIPNHDFELLLRHPNPQDSRYEFLYATIAYYKLNGMSYWFLNRENENAKPDEMWVIPPGMIIPVPDGRMYLKGYMYYPGTGAEIFLQPWEIMQFRSFNPLSRFLGLSKMEALALVAAGDLGMQAYNTTLFKENNGKLPSVMTFESFIEDGTWAKIQYDTREAARNRNMLMLRGVGPGGLQWKNNAVTHEEIEFSQGRKDNQREIMDTIAPGLYTWLSGESTYSNAGANRAAFNELTVYPMHVMMGEKITNDILPSYGGRPLVGMFEDVRIMDRALQLTEQQEYAKTHSVNQINKKYYAGDELFDDERGELLPAQINAQTGAPEPPMIITPTPQPVLGDGLQNPPDQNAPDEQAMKAARDELGRWERKALKAIGERVEFSTMFVSDDTIIRVNAALPRCKDEYAVKALFGRIVADVYPMSEAAHHLEGLKLAIEKQEKR